MIEVKGIDIVEELVESNDRIRKAEKEIRKQRIKELVDEGIDKEIAKVMIDTFTNYEVLGY